MTKKKIHHLFTKEPNLILDHQIKISIPGEARKILAAIKICLFANNPPLTPVTAGLLQKFTGLSKRNVFRSKKTLIDWGGSVKNGTKFLLSSRKSKNPETSKTGGVVSKMAQRGVKNGTKGCQKWHKTPSTLKDSFIKDSYTKEGFIENLKKNFTATPTNILDKERYFSPSGRKGQIYDLIKRYTYGYHKPMVHLSVKFIIQQTEMPRRSVYRALKNLETHKIIYRRAKHFYAITRDTSSWKVFDTKQPEPVHKYEEQQSTPDELRNILIAQLPVQKQEELRSQEVTMGKIFTSLDIQKMISAQKTVQQESGFNFYTNHYSKQ